MFFCLQVNVLNIYGPEGLSSNVINRATDIQLKEIHTRKGNLILHQRFYSNVWLAKHCFLNVSSTNKNFSCCTV